MLKTKSCKVIKSVENHFLNNFKKQVKNTAFLHIFDKKNALFCSNNSY